MKILIILAIVLYIGGFILQGIGRVQAAKEKENKE